MKAHLRSARIAPKKAQIIAAMVRGLPVPQALEALRHTHKKGARMIEQLLASAVANARHNDKQDVAQLRVKTIVVNQGTGYRRGVPMARGRVRPMTKFLSHIEVVLGIAGAEEKVQERSARVPAKAKEVKKPSQKPKNTVQKTRSRKSPAPSSDSQVFPAPRSSSSTSEVGTASSS